MATEYGGLHCACLAYAEVGDFRANLCDDTGELVAQRDRNFILCDGVSIDGAEVGSSEIFMKICSTDADEGGRNL